MAKRKLPTTVSCCGDCPFLRGVANFKGLYCGHRIGPLKIDPDLHILGTWDENVGSIHPTFPEGCPLEIVKEEEDNEL